MIDPMTDCAECEDCIFDLALGNEMTELHEIHVTVSATDPGRFKAVCHQHDIKPIVIEYEGHGRPMLDPMTSQTFRGSPEAALAEAERISDLLEAEGFRTLRTKIETPPFNPNIELTDGGYFESHLAVRIRQETLGELDRAVKRFAFNDSIRPHLSRNAFKKEGEIKTIMITHRRYDCSAHRFTIEVMELSEYLTGLNFEVDRTIVEYCWYDSNIHHDDAWMGTHNGATQ